MRCSRWILASILVSVLFIPGSVRADEGCAHIESRWGLGLSWVVSVSGGTVFFGSGSVLVAVGAATDAERGRIDVGGVIEALSIVGNTAYLAAGPRGLVIVDVSDPAGMRILSTTEDPPHANGVASDGDLAVVTDFWNDVTVFDVSSPGNPVRRSNFDVEGLAQDAVLIGHYAAIAEGTAGVRMLDLSDPADPVSAALIETGGDVNRLRLEGSTLFVGDGRKGLITIDVGDPADPAVLATLPLSGLAAGISVVGTTAWIAGDYTGIFAVDVTDPAAPNVLGTARPGRGIPVDVAADGSNVWFAVYNEGVVRFDGTDPSNPQEAGSYEGAGEMRSVEALGGYAVVADWWGFRLRIFDIDGPGSPVQIGSIELPGYPRRMEISSNTAFVAMEYGGFAVVDLDDPENPALFSTLETVEGRPQDIALMGDVALIVTQSEGLQVIDVTHPEAPSIIGSMDLPDTGNGISVSGDVAYVAASSSGMTVIDVSTPSNPAILSTLDLGAVAVSTTPMGDFVLVSGYYSGLFVVDVSNPVAPVLVGQVDIPNMARSAVVRGDLAFVGSGVRGLSVVDLSDPADPVLTGTTTTASETWYGAFVGDRFVLADGPAGFAVFDVEACGETGNPPQADFDYLPNDPRAGDTVTFRDLSTGGPTSWSWSFDDDGGSSTEQNPTHVFSAPGAFDVRLEVSNADGSSTTTRTVIVRPAEGELPPVDYPFAAVSVIPAAAHVGGAQGTAWVTDVVLHNPRAESVTADLFFLESGFDGSGTTAFEVVVPGDQSMLLADIVRETFGRDRASGAILVGSDQVLVVSSRTYNDVEDGTYGQYIAGVSVNEALGSGGEATVIQLTENDAFRTNIGVANAGAARLDVTVEMRSASGGELGVRTFEVLPWSHVQINGVFADAGQPNLADGYAVIRCDTVGARWFAYASVVDNRSGDPVYVAPVSPSSEAVWIPAAAHVRGANWTNWKTDIEVFTGGGRTDTLNVQWLASEGGMPVDVDLSMSGDPCRRVEDVLATLFQGDGSGALRIGGGGGPLAVTSRTFNDPGDATYGQYIPSIPESEVWQWGEAARLVQLAYSPRPRFGFRTNLGFVNTTGDPVTIYVELRRGDSGYLGALTVDLLPWQYTQLNDVFDGLSDETLDDAYAVVAAHTGGAKYFVYASVVDNRSGDPIYIPAVREP